MCPDHVTRLDAEQFLIRQGPAQTKHCLDFKPKRGVIAHVSPHFQQENPHSLVAQLPVDRIGDRRGVYVGPLCDLQRPVIHVLEVGQDIACQRRTVWGRRRPTRASEERRLAAR